MKSQQILWEVAQNLVNFLSWVDERTEAKLATRVQFPVRIRAQATKQHSAHKS